MRKKWLFLIAISMFSLINSAELDTYFKKPSNKSNRLHSIPNIDFIYMINLDQRPEKFEKSCRLLQPYGIFPYRFSAVNGWELPFETIDDVGVKFSSSMEGGFMGTCYEDDSLEPHHEMIETLGKTYFCHCMSRGAIGIVLSHLSILQDAYDSGYKTIWVMEDDIEVVQDPNILSSLIAQLDALVDGKWDILFTDQNTRNDRGEYVPCLGRAQRPNFNPLVQNEYSLIKRVGKQFRQIGGRYGAYSMIVRRSGMRKILNFFKRKKIFLPYDMDFHLPKEIKFYTVMEDVVAHQMKAASDNGGPNYLYKQP